jgi:hypothetical protein
MFFLNAIFLKYKDPSDEFFGREEDYNIIISVKGTLHLSDT